MSELLKMATMVAVLGISMYVKSQEHEYKIQYLDVSLAKHLDKHEEQYENIQRTLTDMRIQLGLNDKPTTKPQDRGTVYGKQAKE